MLLDDIGSHLQTNGAGTVGTDIFKGTMPDSPTICVAIYEYAGVGYSRTSGSVVSENARIQIVVRDTGYSAARTKAETIKNILDALGNLTIGTTRYLWIEALAPPFLLRRDQAGNVLIACNYQVMKEESA